MTQLFTIFAAAVEAKSPFLREMSMQANMMAQLVISGLIFSTALPPKRWYPFRLLLSLLICAGSTLALTQLRLRHAVLATRFLMRLVQFAMPLTVILLCRRGNFFSQLKTWCAGIAAMEIAASLYSLLLAVMGIDERVSIRIFDFGRTTTSIFDWLFYFAIHIAFASPFLSLRRIVFLDSRNYFLEYENALSLSSHFLIGWCHT